MVWVIEEALQLVMMRDAEMEQYELLVVQGYMRHRRTWGSATTEAAAATTAQRIDSKNCIVKSRHSEKRWLSGG